VVGVIGDERRRKVSGAGSRDAGNTVR